MRLHRYSFPIAGGTNLAFGLPANAIRRAATVNGFSNLPPCAEQYNISPLIDAFL